MSNSTTDHAYKPNGYGVDKCLLCGEKITEHLTPMTLPDDIELLHEHCELCKATNMKHCCVCKKEKTSDRPQA